MKFTDDDLKRLELQAENICAEQMAPMVHMDGHIVKALLARLEAAEAFINEPRCQNGCACDNECEKHLPLEKTWREAKGE